MVEIKTQIEHLIDQAKRRWLEPAEICKIIENLPKSHISLEVPNRPPGGSVFFYNRNVLRHFRNDGFNWRKNRDGKLAKEAHERLKCESVGVLQCYYSYGNDGDQNIRRRIYWTIKKEPSHIAFVHYLEVEVEGTAMIEGNGGNINEDSYERASPVTGTTGGFNTTLPSECGEAERVYRYQASPELQSIHDLQTPAMETMDAGSIPNHPVPLSNNYQGQSSAIPTMTFGSIRQGEESKAAMNNGLLQDIDLSSVHSSPMSPMFGSQFGSHVLQDIPTITKPARPQQRRHFRCRRRLPLQHTQGNKENFNGVLHVDGIVASQRNEEVIYNCYTKVDRSAASVVQPSGYQRASLVTDTTSLNTTQPSEHEEAEPLRDITRTHQESPGFQYTHELQTPAMQAMDADSISYHSVGSVPISNNYYQGQSSAIPAMTFGSIRQGEESITAMDYGLQRDIDWSSVHSSLTSPMFGPEFGSHELQASERQSLHVSLLTVEGAMQEGLERQDSFDLWVNMELSDDIGPTMQLGPETVGSEDDFGIATQVPLHNYFLGPSSSQNQVYSIIDFSPILAYSGTAIKVLIIGKFLKSQEELKNHKWACMFGEIEVPAEIIGDGGFCCHTPVYGVGRVPFCITRSNRIACSEVREFEFRDIPAETRLRMRFGKLLSLGSGTPQISVQSVGAETSRLCGRISEMLKYDVEWERLLNLYEHDHLSATEQEVQMFLKEKLHNWLLQKIVEGGKGPNVLDEYGQGVLHYAAALGYDWAIRPIIEAGVSVHFLDAYGCTALQWAAIYDRERSVNILQEELLQTLPQAMDIELLQTLPQAMDI